MLFVVVHGNFLQIFGLENLIAVETTKIINPVASRQHLCTTVLAEHNAEEYPYSKRVRNAVKPPICGAGGDHGFMNGGNPGQNAGVA